MEPQAKGKFKVCEKCPKKAYYNILGTRSPLFCGDHREPNMFNVVSVKCRHQGCLTVPCFGEPGKPARFCAIHREEGMVNIHERPCQYEGCSKKPVFNLPGQARGIWCIGHKTPEMIDVLSASCQHEGCITRPSFGPKGGKRLFCAKHKMEGMVSTNTICDHEGCKTSATFNFPGETTVRFCSKHKEVGMTSIRAKHCQDEGCMIYPLFNFPTEKKGIFCKKHKLGGMVDVENDKCEYDGCLKKPTFNLQDLKPKFCKAHKTQEMINVFTRRCEHEGCATVPVYNLPGIKRGRFCKSHKTDEMIDVVSKRCKTPMCDTTVQSTIGASEHCMRCTSYLFPDQAKGGWFKTRETKLKEYLESRYTDKTIVHDRRVECHLYRPDFVFDMGSHTVVIELDENQHKRYDNSCDNKRLMSIFHGLGSRPMVMMRFNPDRYDSVPGCFKKDGQLVDLGRPWKRRLESLAGRIDHWLESQPDREITIEHLFFDTDK